MTKKSKEYFKTLENIDYKFAFPNDVSERERGLIAKALSLCEDSVIDDITQNVWFVSPNSGYIAFQVNILDLMGKWNSMIFLNSLNNMPEKKAIRIILHEIGHHVLKHTSPILMKNVNYANMVQVGKKQEKEADAFAKERMKKKLS